MAQHKAGGRAAPAPFLSHICRFPSLVAPRIHVDTSLQIRSKQLYETQIMLCFIYIMYWFFLCFLCVSLAYYLHVSSILWFVCLWICFALYSRRLLATKLALLSPDPLAATF